MIENIGGDASGFADLALAPELRHALSGLGYEEPTPIQRAGIPPLLEGRDLVGQAATGTGKTAAFALPVLQRLLREGRRAEPLALVLVPTRELAVQVSEAMHRYGRDIGARVLPIYGGQPIGRQLRALDRGTDVVVATPGRALDHISRGTLSLRGLKIVILDEADEMLDMGFAEDIEAILGNTPENRQTALFSATMPPRINGMVRRHLRDPVRAELGRQTSAPADGLLVQQSAYVVPRGHKPAALGRVLFRSEDRLDVLGETHVEHLVRFVEDDDLEATQAQRSPGDVVKRAPGRRHHHVDATIKRPQLPADWLSAVDRQNTRANVTPVAMHRLRDLHCEFACRHEHQGERLCPPAFPEEPLEYGKREGGRLPRPGRGLPDQITALQQRRDGSPLYRCRLLITEAR